MDTALQHFVHDFLEVRGLTLDGDRMEQLRGDGSKRLFWRIPCLGSDERFIVLSNPPSDSLTRKENVASVRIGMHLKSKGVPVPEIYAFDLDKGWIIMEDLGRMRLQDAVAAGQDPIPVYQEIVALLLYLQLKGAEGFDTRWCCQTPYYDHSVMRIYESNYFRDAFLGLSLGLKKDWMELDPAFEHVAARLSLSRHSFFLYRDFQSRNILVDNGRIGFVDWQGGRLGPLGYDLASLLIDPYVALSPETQETIFQVYADLLRKHDSALADELERDYPFLALQRNLQILGAFATLTKVHGKAYFEEYIPSAVQSLTQRLKEMPDPELSPLKNLMTDLSRNFWLDKPSSTG
ncbi:MAG: phosphotransferase [Deltaproteobacteria bacterium]|nr:phosphotransferase [Deltaproteobacteria bacterium]